MTADSDLFSAHPLRRPPTSSNYNKEVNKYYELDFRSLEKEKGNTSSTDGLTHSIQKHPATFIPQIPRYLIETYLDSKEEQLVADIFSGSGTTGVEAVSHGHSYLGIEVNPLSVLVSRVATHPYPKEILNEALNFVLYLHLKRLKM
jgi:DNA modification methylase